ncbi:hypothetical protein OG871_40065 (plasmid) [Kitasatospora sp. NBC_00374]|uniref:hypothetical protein n=1 Tax=Kitasatospora sp. NBC_00374 TaxID=2975964 RepID=UPI002F916031
MTGTDLPADEVSRRAQELLTGGTEDPLGAAQALWARWWERRTNRAALVVCGPAAR